MTVQGVSLRIIFLIAAIICFVIALLLAISVFSGGNEKAWEIGGFLALVLSFL